MGRVFLAECTPDLDSERVKMKLFLEEKGWLVLPESDYDAANYETLLERDLRSAIGFVQLIGPYPWKRGGFDVLQNEKAKSLTMPRFRRRDLGIEVSQLPEAQRAFVSAPGVIAAGFEDFKLHLDAELQRLRQEQQPRARTEGSNTPLVHVAVRADNADPLWDKTFTWLQVADVLGYLLKPDESFEQKHSAEPCHGFLILCDHSASLEGPRSARDQIDQCRIIQMKEKDAARRPPVGVVYWPPPPPAWSRILRSGALKMHRIVADAPETELDNFLAEVRKVAS